ncbi:hypothetical protein CAOG_000751 [Capsaspora owczarzaki ATCC 30864]|uniref:Uncharacterized protein n=2 Tax=Capsaspora owczarzaki (strain ATCC 30864) TaxID=595528 RepID=A0A0D2WJ42_CAPO3|nr:hypothetical protein CAOG_000751 [Capsaspora owczarzaki ATCC 30864]
MVATLSKKAVEKKCPVPPLEAAKVAAPPPKKMTPEEFRSKIVDEIRLTEQAYVKDLMSLNHSYIRPLRQVEFIHPSDFKKLFGNVIDIFEFQKRFFKKLAQTSSLPPDQQRIGACFLDHKEAFKVYTMYCANHPNAVATLLKYETLPKWKAFAANWTKTTGKLFDIGSSLIKPIQRICKYPLLLRELIKHTPETHPDFADITEAMDAMNSVTIYINEMKRKLENLQVMAQLHTKIHNWSGPSLVSSGELIQDGMVTQIDGTNKETVYLLLLGKQTAICRKRKKDEYDYKRSAPNDYLVLKNLSDEQLPFGFTISSTVPTMLETWSFQCKNAGEKNQWLAALSKTIKVDPSGFKSTSIVAGAVTQTDQSAKFTAESNENKVRFAFGYLKALSDSQLQPELAKQQQEFASAEQRTEAMFEPSKSLERELRERAANVEELKAEIARRAELAAAAKPAVAPKPAARPPAPLPSKEAPKPAPAPVTSAPTSSERDSFSDMSRASINSHSGVLSALGPNDTLGLRINSRPTLTAMDETLSDFESMSVIDVALPTISEEEHAPLPDLPTTEENSAAVAAMELLATELEDQRTKCAHCNEVITDPTTSTLALGKTWHQDHFCCQACKTPLSGCTYHEKDGNAYCNDDYQRLFNSCEACRQPINDGEFVTIGDNSNMRWHKHHFECEHCKENLLSSKIYERLGKIYCEKDFKAQFGVDCGLCGQLIEGKYMVALEHHWHENCFVCNYEGCRAPFPDGRFYNHNNAPYCELHFHTITGSLCNECQKPVLGRHITSATGKVHPECLICTICRRQLSLSEPVQEVVSGGKARFLCGNCVA